MQNDSFTFRISSIFTLEESVDCYCKPIIKIKVTRSNHLITFPPVSLCCTLDGSSRVEIETLQIQAIRAIGSRYEVVSFLLGTHTVFDEYNY